MIKTLILFALFFPAVALAQRYPTGKGTYRTGGGASFTSSREVDFNEYKFTITPRFGYFITDEWLTGFALNYTMTVDTNFISAIKFTPQVKYYYPLSQSTFILATVEVGVDRATTFGYSKSIVDHTSISAGPGVAYYFSRRIGFEINILYQQYLNPDNTHMSKINATGGFLLNILNKNDRAKKIKNDYKLREEDDE
ncbi:MAG: outer membrane beta-barrel protein [Bacteroidetes bacterium]|nr:outer membrane beta-barrel protein [Bacteroidota bacterium]MBK7569157.1 outer membrane beta-barrel protein [Bacteroidota bacterium]